MANEIRIFLMTKEGQEFVRKQKAQQILPPEPKSIFYDHFCSVTPEYLVVKRFFCPSLLPYDFEWHKIQKVTYTPQENERYQNVRDKGLDETEDRWWAFDELRASDRELKLYNIRIDSDTVPPKSGFTVTDLDAFLAAARPLLPFNCKISGCRFNVE